MFKDFGISEEDWNSTPKSVKTVVVALQHQAPLLEIRFIAYEHKLAALEAKDAEIEKLTRRCRTPAISRRAHNLISGKPCG
jgi:hypothetical protein